MTNSVYDALGEKRIREICKEHGLDSEDEKVIKNILDKWEHLTGQQGRKMLVALRVLENNINSKEIISAISLISSEFAGKGVMKNREN